MDSLGFEALRTSVIDSLSSVSQSTEEIFLKMGESFPVLVRELSASFGPSSASDSPRTTGPLQQMIGASVQSIEHHEATFTREDEESRQLSARLDDQLATLGSLSSDIGEIREDSVLMELISLNALVIAVKAGESGRAFSCITAELKKLSNETMDQTDRIAAGEEGVRRLFAEFQASLKDLNDRERQGFAGFLSRVRQVFEGLESGAGRLSQGLEAIRGRSEAVKGPLVQIMVDIQNQDRIRQGIDHVLLSLEEFRSVDAGAPLNDQLDELSFLEILPDLSTMVLDEIAGQIRDSRTGFHRCLGQAKDLIEQLEQERAAFLARHLETRGPGSLEAGFRQGEAEIRDFVGQTEGLVRHRETIVRRSEHLRKGVGTLVDSLRTFDGLVSRFRNIDLASRIQVARQAALASMRDNASEMTGLTRKIEGDVNHALEITSTFHGAVETLFETYRGQFAVRVRSDEAFEEQLRNTLEGLKEAEAALVQSFRNSRVFTESFSRLFAQTEEDLVVLDRLLDAIEAQRGQLANLKAKITEQKQQLLGAHRMSGWKLANEKLKGMIDRFTIFTHKKFAAEIGNFEVDQGVDSGEVTLF